MIHFRLPGAVLAILAICLSASAQQATAPIPEVAAAYAITNATVVQSPGDTLKNATVVLRDGLIVSVDPEAQVPFDAEAIAGDSLMVYAAFIDGLSHTGIPAPKEEQQERPSDVKPGTPPPDLAGIQPQRDVRTLFDPSDKSVAQLREAGFGISHAVPRGRMLPGQGSIVLLSDESQPQVIAGNVSQFAQFTTARGVYPATRMAILATWHDLVPNARRHARMKAAFEAQPAGLERPAYDPVLDAMEGVASGKQPVYFLAETPLEVYRAQALAEKLDLDLVLAEVKDGRLALLEDAGAAGTPVLLSLDLPKEIKEKKAKQDSTASEEPAAVELKGRVQNSADTEDEKTRLEARQRQARKSFVAAAGQLVERDITFGFSVQDVKASDIRKNLKELVDAGLSEEKALAALTTEPASMLGISDVAGSVEEGKIANLLVTTGSYFDENSAIRYVFVDGKKFEYKASNKKSGGSGEGAVEVAGTWTYELESPMGASSGTIVIEGSEGDYEGVFTNEQFPGEPELESISVDGNSLSMSVTIDAGGQSMTVQIVCTVDGDEMEGSMDVGQMGSFPLEATRTSDPDQQ